MKMLSRRWIVTIMDRSPKKEEMPEFCPGNSVKKEQEVTSVSKNYYYSIKCSW